MGFATAWLEKHALFPQFIATNPEPDTGIIIVIPACGEADASSLLSSLAACDIPACHTEVIFVVNASDEASPDTIELNKSYLSEILTWKNSHKKVPFTLHCFDTGPRNSHTWGVGMARKTGMDEALRRFDILGKPDGVIVNLDADCRVEPDYLTSIERDFLNNRKVNACSIRFEHPLEGNLYPEIFYDSIIKYELHLRCIVLGIRLAGLPYPFHTVGSAMGVRASAYMKAGGMNRRQAGEDFYFIQKLVMMGGYFNLNTTKVYPASRASSRVPFGTGATITRLTSSDDNNLLTYTAGSYLELREIDRKLPDLFYAQPDDYAKIYETLPAGLKMYVQYNEWNGTISEIKSNVSSFEAFRKRYYNWFNMFRFVKYMNQAHRSVYKKDPVMSVAEQILKISGVTNIPDNERDMLIRYREMEAGCN